MILQQTRVSQGLPYFHRFVERFPDVHTLANADQSEVLKVWEGLGYYSRARNLHEASKAVAFDNDGQFPKNYHEIIQLKGIGPYTAAAIASICFGEPTPVIDGNVYRVVSRLFGVSDDISESKTRKVFLDILQELIPEENPGDFNQAMMELGATVCTPKSPKCEQCPLSLYCFARKEKRQSEFPVKSKKVKVRSRQFHYLVIQHRGEIGIRKREQGDIWEGLYEFGLIENGRSELDLSFSAEDDTRIEAVYGPMKHILSHQVIHAKFYHILVNTTSSFHRLLNYYDLHAISSDEVVTLPKSKLIVNFLNQFNF